jgi:methionyl-tRNA formyltransferase
MKVIFLGTPAFAETILRAICRSSHRVSAVVTQPDRVNARGGKTIASPVKQAAEELGLPIHQFERISREGVEILRAYQADIMVTAAYGQILSREILSLCPYGVINVHGSLLPKYRGACPVQCSILNGEKEIGVSIMQTEYEVDSGSVILVKKILLDGNENCAEATAKLAVAGAEAIVEALDQIEAGRAVFTPQDPGKATFCKKICKEDGRIDFSRSAADIKNQIRAYTPWPSAYTETPFGMLKILRAEVVEGEFPGEPGEVVVSDKNGILIKCGRDALRPTEVQAEGSRAMDAASFLRGHAIGKGTKLL